MANQPPGMHPPRHANSMPQAGAPQHPRGATPGYPATPPGSPPPAQPLPQLPYPTGDFLAFPSEGPGPAPPKAPAAAFSAIPSALLHGGAAGRPHSASLNSRLPGMVPAPLNYRPAPKSWQSAAGLEGAAIQRPASTSAQPYAAPAGRATEAGIAQALTVAALMNGGKLPSALERQMENDMESPVLGNFSRINSAEQPARVATPATVVTNEHGAVVQARPGVKMTVSDTQVPRARPAQPLPQSQLAAEPAGRPRASSDLGSTFGVQANPWAAAAAPAPAPAPAPAAFKRQATTKAARNVLARELENHIRSLAHAGGQAAPAELPAHEADVGSSGSDSDSQLGDATPGSDERTLALLDLYFAAPDEEARPKLVRSITKSIKKRARTSSDERSQLASLVAQLRSPADDEPFSATSIYSPGRDQWEDSLLPTAHPDGLVPNPLSVGGTPVSALASPPWSAVSSVSSDGDARSNRPKLSLKTTPSKLKPASRARAAKKAAAAAPPVPPVPAPAPAPEQAISRGDTLQREYAGYKAQYSEPQPPPAQTLAPKEPFQPRPRAPSYEGHGWYDGGEWATSAVTAKPSPVAPALQNPDRRSGVPVHAPPRHADSVHVRAGSPPKRLSPPPQPRPHRNSVPAPDPPAHVVELPSREAVVAGDADASGGDENERRNERRREWEAARDAERAREDDEIRAEIAAARAAAAAEQQASAPRYDAAEHAPEPVIPQQQPAKQKPAAAAIGSGRRFAAAQGRQSPGLVLPGRRASPQQGASISPPLYQTQPGLSSPPVDERGRAGSTGYFPSPPPSSSGGFSARHTPSPGFRAHGKASPLSIGRLGASQQHTPPPSGGSLGVPEGRHRAASSPGIVPLSAPLPHGGRHSDELAPSEYGSEPGYGGYRAPSDFGGSEPGARAAHAHGGSAYGPLSGARGRAGQLAPAPSNPAYEPHPGRPFDPGHARSRSVGPPAKDAQTIEREIAIATGRIEVARAEMRQREEVAERKKGWGLRKLGLGSAADAVGKIF